MVSAAIGRIEADRILEERVIVDAVDLVYRPVYAFRYRHAGKEAVIEFDGLTGEARGSGSTFEQYFGKVFEPRFLLDAGIEAVNLFVPGTQLARIVVEHGVQRVIERRARGTRPTRRRSSSLLAVTGEITVFSGSAHHEFAEEMCQILGVELFDARTTRFSNDCLQVQLRANCRQRDVYVVQSLVPPVQENLFELLLMLDAARGASAATSPR